MSIKRTGSLNISSAIYELKQLSAKEVLVGFFGENDSKLLTIVRANEFGATIRPKNSSYLWVPNLSVTQGKKASEIQGLFVPNGKHVAVVNKSQASGLGRDPKGDPSSPFVICFYLMKNVTIPARPFIRTAFEANRGKYGRIIKRGIQSIINGSTTADALLNRLGVTAVTDIQKSAIRWKVPGNSALTIANKKNTDNPLINLGLNGGMIGKVTYMIMEV